MNVRVGDLLDRLSRHLATVRSGQTITATDHRPPTTDHGQPIARIVPVGRMTRLEQLLAEGRVRPAGQRKTPAPDPVPATGLVSDLVPDQRR